MIGCSACRSKFLVESGATPFQILTNITNRGKHMLHTVAAPLSIKGILYAAKMRQCRTYAAKMHQCWTLILNILKGRLKESVMRR